MYTGYKVLAISALLAGGLIALLAWRPGRELSRSPLLVYCAAGVRLPVEKIAAEYAKEHGVEVQLQYGGSGTLLANLRVARRGDIYIATEKSTMDLARGASVAHEVLVREVLSAARQRPVILVPKGNPRALRRLDDLLRPDLRLALGNPEAAAIGKLTRDALRRLGMWEALQRRVTEGGVFKPTVPDIANDVKIGAADAGIVWDSTARQYPELEAVAVPEFDGISEPVQVGILTSSENPTRALHFARYLTARDRGLLRFRELGFEAVDGDAWADRPRIVLFSGGVNRLAIDETIKAFQEREGVDVETIYNGCGILVGQMRAGGRPDAYFACDTSYMEEVTDLFLEAEPISETDMVLIVRKGNPLRIEGLRDLTREGVKVAVANPDYSALGGLTRKLLEEVGIHDAVWRNITYGDAPTADFVVARVRTEREDVAIVYRANAMKRLDELEIVPIDHPAAKAAQPISIGKESRHRHLAERLVAAIKTAESRRRFEASGFRWAGRETVDAGVTAGDGVMGGDGVTAGDGVTVESSRKPIPQHGPER